MAAVQEVVMDVAAKQRSAAFCALFGGDTVLCDGAMGTMLYSGGVFINRSFDELNVTEPETVRGVHNQYLQAGAQVIETNTFGANRIRLQHFGLADRVREFNEAGVRLARASAKAHELKQGSAVWVAGAVGSVGYREGAPFDRAAVRSAFAEQIEALVGVGEPGEGIDLLIGETMMSIAEAEEMAAAAREIAPHLPLTVLMTVGEDGRCLDGTPIEEAARRLEAAGADAVGVNCSSGPEAVLDAIRRMRSETRKPLVAMPNAGLPQMVEGRHIYLSSPEYMASLARKFVRAGASWVGGCCGTTPAHIRAMRSGLRALQAMASGEGAMREVEGDAGSGDPAVVRAEVAAVEAALAPQIMPPPLAERSGVGRRIAAGEFVTMVEIVPPKGFDCARELAGAKLLAGRGVHAINVPDSPRASPRMSGTSLCLQIQQQAGIETVLHYTCRDRNLMSIQSDLLGAASLGLKNILCLTGDPPKMGGYPDATAVFDVDAIGLARIVRGLNHGRDIGGHPLPGSPGFAIAVAANPGVQDIEHEIRRFAYKVEAGAEFCITQPVFDLRLLEQFLRRIEGFRIPVVAGIWPLTSRKNAEFMRDQLKVSVPDEILNRMARVGEGGDKQAMLAEGIRIAQEMLAAVRADVQGAQVSAPFAKFAAAAAVLGLHGTETHDA